MRMSAGVAFKPQHFDEALASPADGLWFEVHAENYMVEGGPRLAMLEALRSERPIALHGVGLSLGSPERPDPDHLGRLKQLADWIEPALVSEHLAWSRIGTRCVPDLLPVVRTEASLRQIKSNIDEVQETLGCRLLIENPAHYLDFEHDWPEAEFLAELERTTGCGLLIDVNNVWVAAHNLSQDPETYIASLPHSAIGEIHVAGHSIDPDPTVNLLIDSHDAPVSEPVWALLEKLMNFTGPRPVLLERDGNIPSFAQLMAERERAVEIIRREELHHA